MEKRIAIEGEIRRIIKGQYEILHKQCKYLDEGHFIFKNAPFKQGEYLLFENSKYKVVHIKLNICDHSEFIYQLEEII